MDYSRPLYWHQGLFLQPQHFQQLQRQIEANTSARSSIGSVAGISSLEIDNAALANGVLTVEKLECLMPDGTLLKFPGNLELAPLTLRGDMADAAGAIEVFLTLPVLDVETGNLALDNGVAAKRYRMAAEASVNDIFHGDDRIDLQPLTYGARLEAGEQDHDKRSVVREKIAEIVSDGGEYRRSSGFVGNVVALQASPVLCDAVKSIKQSLIARYDQLESFSSLNNAQGGELSATSFANMMALNALAAYVPVLSQYEEVPAVAPQALYLTLRQLVAQLSAFSKGISLVGETADPADSLLGFQQANLSECFRRVFRLVNRLLDELTVDPELFISLEAQGEGKYVSAITPDFRESRNRIYLRLRSVDDLDSRIDDIVHASKFGADGQVDIYLKRSLPGIQLDHLTRKPLGVASTPNSYYFSVDCRGFEWQKVLEAGRVSLIWPGAPKDLLVEIIAVKG